MLNEEKKQQRDMMIAMVLVIGVLMLFNRLTAKPEETVQVPLETPTVVEAQAVETAPAIAERNVPSEKQVVVPMKNNFVAGSFVANNTDFNNLLLTQYKETTEKKQSGYFFIEQEFSNNFRLDGGESAGYGDGTNGSRGYLNTRNTDCFDLGK